MTTITKKERSAEVLARQLQFIEDHPHISPRVISQDWDSLSYRYERIEGEHCPVERVPQLLEMMRANVWCPHEVSDFTIKLETRQRYIDHCLAAHPRCEMASHLLEGLMTCDLTAAVDVHGDLTLENVILQYTSLYLIDASPCRGMRCVENDRGKILQSALTGWKMKPVSVEELLWATWGDYYMCASHWCRLLKHHPDQVTNAESAWAFLGAITAKAVNG